MGTTPLLRAAAGQFLEVVKVLLQYRADVDKARNDGVTPLQFAAGGLRRGGRAQGGEEDVDSAPPGRLQRPPRRCSPLLQSRTDTTLKNQWKRTALAHARQQGHDTLLVQAEEGGAR